MNISKNLLSLGLIAVISGISTAQTYSGTAGTNGITDIQSDYSMSTGDGASVSVDVPLEFELPKKVAISMRDGGDGALSSNSLFAPPVAQYWTQPASRVLDTTPQTHAAWNNTSNNYINYKGAIYANTAISVTADFTDFLHETDTNSIMKGVFFFRGIHKDTKAQIFYIYDDNDSATSKFPATANISDSALIATDNLFGLELAARVYVDSIDPTDRAGKYTSIATITVSTL